MYSLRSFGTITAAGGFHVAGVPRPGSDSASAVLPVAAGPNQVSLSEIISALSFALDLVEDAKPGHAIRTCLLGMRIAECLRLGISDSGDLYYALLLKDLGCSTNARLICQLVGGDDRTIKREAKLQ